MIQTAFHFTVCSEMLCILFDLFMILTILIIVTTGKRVYFVVSSVVVFCRQCFLIASAAVRTLVNYG